MITGFSNAPVVPVKNGQETLAAQLLTSPPDAVRVHVKVLALGLNAAHAASRTLTPMLTGRTHLPPGGLQ